MEKCPTATATASHFFQYWWEMVIPWSVWADIWTVGHTRTTNEWVLFVLRKSQNFRNISQKTAKMGRFQWKSSQNHKTFFKCHFNMLKTCVYMFLIVKFDVESVFRCQIGVSRQKSGLFVKKWFFCVFARTRKLRYCWLLEVIFGNLLVCARSNCHIRTTQIKTKYHSPNNIIVAYHQSKDVTKSW